MSNCKNCHSSEVTKNGFVRSKQRYRCKTSVIISLRETREPTLQSLEDANRWKGSGIGETDVCRANSLVIAFPHALLCCKDCVFRWQTQLECLSIAHM